MTQWDELERDLRLSVHPTFADKLLDNALESDNMLGAYGEIADLVATLRAPATAGELSSQSDAVAEMSKLLQSAPGSSATGVVLAGKKAMAVAAAAASLATGSAFAAGLPAAVQDLAASVSGALVGLVDRGSERSVAEPPGAADGELPAPAQDEPAEQPPAVGSSDKPAPAPDASPTVDASDAALVDFNPPNAAAPEPPAGAPAMREAALPVGSSAGPSNPDDDEPDLPVEGNDGEPVPPVFTPPVLGPPDPLAAPPPSGGTDFQPTAPFLPPILPTDDGDDGEAAARPPVDDGGSGEGDEVPTDEGGDQSGGGEGQGAGGDDQGDDGGDQGGDGGQQGGGDDGDQGGGDDGDQGGGEGGGTGGDNGQGGGGGDQGGGDGGQGDDGCQSNGNANGSDNGNGNGNANGHCKHEDGDDHNHGGGNG